MAHDDQPNDTPEGDGGPGAAKSGRSKPEWAGGLKQLYDSVVEEPIPDSFMDLLDKLDGEAIPSSGDDDMSAGDGEGQ